MAAIIGPYKDSDPANITRGQLAEFELRAKMAERERCARIIESAAGFPTHKLRREAAAAIRNPNTFWQPRDNG